MTVGTGGPGQWSWPASHPIPWRQRDGGDWSTAITEGTELAGGEGNRAELVPPSPSNLLLGARIHNFGIK